MAGENVWPKSDGDVWFASDTNGLRNSIYNSLVTVPTVSPALAVLAHSATAWTTVEGTNTQVSSDTGVTWANATTDNAAMTGVSKVSSVTKTLGISCDHNSNAVYITSNSGVDWAVASTPITANATRVLDLSFPTATVAVAALDLGTATRGIYFSADAGDTWTICTTGPAADVLAIYMVDGSDGIAIDSAGNIWTTGDSGDNWTDSGQNVTSIAIPSTIIALTSTTGVKLSLNDAATVETFTTGAGGTTRLRLRTAAGGNSYISNLAKITNGNLYFIFYLFNNADSTSNSMTLYRSTDSGVTWQQRALGSTPLSALTILNTNITKSQVVEYDTNKLLILVGNNELMTIDESSGV